MKDAPHDCRTLRRDHLTRKISRRKMLTSGAATMAFFVFRRRPSLRAQEQAKWIIKTRYANGTMLYNLADTSDSLFMVRPDKRRMVTLNYDAPLTTDSGDPDGTPAFRDMFRRLEINDQISPAILSP